MGVGRGFRGVKPTPPARPHFTHLRAGDLEIFAGISTPDLPISGAFAPDPETAEELELLAFEEITLGYRLDGEPGPL